MARRLITPQRKLRGVARRLRALGRWPREVATAYPDDEELRAAPRYWNWKLPVDLHLVESRWTATAIRRACAQRLIAARAASTGDCRATCVACLQDLFTSGPCLYRSEERFRSHTSASVDRPGDPDGSKGVGCRWSGGCSCPFSRQGRLQRAALDDHPRVIHGPERVG